jgi:hypothetical protein
MFWTTGRRTQSPSPLALERLEDRCLLNGSVPSSFLPGPCPAPVAAAFGVPYGRGGPLVGSGNRAGVSGSFTAPRVSALGPGVSTLPIAPQMPAPVRGLIGGDDAGPLPPQDPGLAGRGPPAAGLPKAGALPPLAETTAAVARDFDRLPLAGLPSLNLVATAATTLLLTGALDRAAPGVMMPSPVTSSTGSAAASAGGGIVGILPGFRDPGAGIGHVTESGAAEHPTQFPRLPDGVPLETGVVLRTAGLLVEGMNEGLTALERALRALAEPPQRGPWQVSDSLYWLAAASWLVAAALAADATRRLPKRAAGLLALSSGRSDLPREEAP